MLGSNACVKLRRLVKTDVQPCTRPNVAAGVEDGKQLVALALLRALKFQKTTRLTHWPVLIFNAVIVIIFFVRLGMFQFGLVTFRFYRSNDYIVGGGKAKNRAADDERVPAMKNTLSAIINLTVMVLVFKMLYVQCTLNGF